MSFSKEESVIPNEHLSFDQIRGAAGAGPSSLPSAASAHLGDCRQCAELVKFVNGLGAVKPDPTTDLGNCPSHVVLLEIAEGLTVPDTSLYRHITQCHRCVTSLREFSEDLKDENLPETKDLRTATPTWQLALARKISSSAERTRGSKLALISFGQRTRWVYAASILAIFALTVVLWFVWRSRPAYADRLLAEAYTAQRTMEMRIQGARYGPLRVTRGPEVSRLDRPPELLQAEAVIAGALASHPNDPSWLGARGRAELLDWQYEAAIKSFNHALEALPNSPALLTDLASAYFQRAEAQDRAIDYGTCIDLLGQALAKNSDDPVALFNRALTEERLFLYNQAIKDWEQYLRVDPGSEWAQEAKQRLADLQEKIREHDRSSAEELLDPALIRQAESHHDSTVASVDRRIEDYLRVATRDWLSVAFPVKKAGVSTEQSQDARGALLIVATTARSRRGDDWLADLLHKTSSPSFPAAVMALSNAIRAGESGRYALALREASRAAKLFHAVGNDAGAFRARAEEVYALHFSERSQRCLSDATSLIRGLQKHRYPWLTIQLQLEYSICSNMVGNIGAGQARGTAAVQSASKIGYNTILLRGLNLVATLGGTSGNFEAAWTQDRIGLARYWNGNYPPMRAHSFYAGMDLLAEDNRQWFLDMTVLQEGLAVISPNENRVLQAVAHDRLGRAALMAGLPWRAEAEFREAALLYASSPQDGVTKAREAHTQIWLARVEVRRGELDKARERLVTAHKDVAGTSYRYSEFDFYQTLGELQAQRGDMDGAEGSLRSAVAMAEMGLQSLRSEHDRLTWDRETSTAYRALVQLKLRRQDGLGALETWEWYRGAALRQGTRDPQPGPSQPQLTMVSNLLPFLTEFTVVSYGLLPEGLAIWAYDSRGVTAKLVLRDPKEIERLARRFRELCADQSSDLSSLHREGKKLYDLLIAPIAEGLPEGRPLMIEADQALADVPLEVLQDPRHRYLIDLHEMVWSPGLYFAARLRPSFAFKPRLRALVVGVSGAAARSPDSAPPVEDAIREAEIVASKISGARLLVASNATLGKVESELPHAVIFHFAGHAFSGLEGTGLPLARDASGNPAILTAAALNALRLRTRLAVLAGCSTEKGINGSVFDDNSMARAFLRAGTPHVVASRWNVDSKLTADFTGAFYDRLLSGNRVSDALRVAAAQVRADPARAHPFYWAAFKAFGRR